MYIDTQPPSSASSQRIEIIHQNVWRNTDSTPSGAYLSNKHLQNAPDTVISSVTCTTSRRGAK